MVQLEKSVDVTDSDQFDEEFMKIILYVLIVTQPIRFIAGIALIVGILKQKSMPLSVWLAVQMLGVFRIIRAMFIFVSSKHINSNHVNDQREDLIEIVLGFGKMNSRAIAI